MTAKLMADFTIEGPLKSIVFNLFGKRGDPMDSYGRTCGGVLYSRKKS